GYFSDENSNLTYIGDGEYALNGIKGPNGLAAGYFTSADTPYSAKLVTDNNIAGYFSDGTRTAELIGSAGTGNFYDASFSAIFVNGSNAGFFTDLTNFVTLTDGTYSINATGNALFSADVNALQFCWNDGSGCLTTKPSTSNVVDTNWQTDWTAFDTNMKNQYREYAVDLNTTETIGANIDGT
ncbi:MAG: hypothetical protein H7836_18225, partial [Magnetococcus sp. YQC-3]